MECPYCGKINFIPDVVIRNTESYGGGKKNFRCLYCRKVVKGYFTLKVGVRGLIKTDEESDW